MKILKNFKVIVALILSLGAIGLLIGYYSHAPSSEISRAQMLQLLDNKLITRAAISPMVYQGFYAVEGSYVAKPGAKPKSFTITTHLDEPQIKGLLAQSNTKVELPGQGGKSQLVNIISSLIIVSLIGALVVHQMRIGKGKSSQKIKTRPSTRFKDVAGVSGKYAIPLLEYLDREHVTRRVGDERVIL